MGLKLWDGEALLDGTLYLWDGTDLVPGEMKLYPWVNVGGVSLVGVTLIVGPNASSISFDADITGGTHDTNYTGLDIIVGGTA